MDQLNIDWTLKHYGDICNAKNATYCGIPIKKNPLDLWIMQEIIFQRAPWCIVEVGIWKGGSTAFLSHTLQRISRHGKIVAVDIQSHTSILSGGVEVVEIQGDIAAKKTLDAVRSHVQGRPTMVIHDADHQAPAVLRDIKNLAPLVTKGQYLIVEDGIIDVWGKGPGPLTAINTFMEGNEDFRIDKSRERYGITWNPGGYLERVQ